jgi:hypothetical protein
MAGTAQSGADTLNIKSVFYVEGYLRKAEGWE